MFRIIIVVALSSLLGCSSKPKYPEQASVITPAQRTIATATIFEDELQPFKAKLVKNMEERFGISINGRQRFESPNRAYARISKGNLYWGKYSQEFPKDRILISVVTGKELPREDETIRDITFEEENYDNTQKGISNTVMHKSFVVDGYLNHSMVYSRPKIWTGDRVNYNGKEMEVIGVAYNDTFFEKNPPSFVLLAPPGATDVKKAVAARTKNITLKKRFWETAEWKAMMTEDQKNNLACDPEKLQGEWESVEFECRRLPGVEGQASPPDQAKLVIKKIGYPLSIDYYRRDENGEMKQSGYYRWNWLNKPVRGACILVQGDAGLGGAMIGPGRVISHAGIVPGSDLLEVGFDPKETTPFCRGLERNQYKQFVRFRRVK